MQGKTKPIAKGKKPIKGMRPIEFHPDDILGKGKRVRSVARKGWRKHREFGGDKNHEYNIHICVSQNTQNVQ